MKTGLNIRQLAVFLACLAGLGSVPSLAVEPAKAGKFDLVFLVGVDEAELKPGVAVFVEPMFFTDGKKFIFVYDYCRQVMEKKFKWKYPREYKGPHLLLSGEIDEDDKEFTLSYCDNKSFSMNGDRYSLLNNRGESIKLGEIDFEFSGDGSHDRFIIPPTLPNTGRAKVLNSPGKAQDSEKRAAQVHKFFFAAKNEELLKKILPTSSINDHAASTLLQQAIAYGEKYKGVHRAWVKDYPGCSSNSWCDLGTDGRFKNASILLAQSLIGDFDGDGAPDAAVGIQAEIVGQGGGGAAWLATVVIHSGGRRVMVSGIEGASAADSSLQGSYLHRNSYRPLGVFQFGACKHLLLIETPVLSLRMLNVSGVASRCLDTNSVRELEDPENEYPPR